MTPGVQATEKVDYKCRSSGRTADAMIIVALFILAYNLYDEIRGCSEKGLP